MFNINQSSSYIYIYKYIFKKLLTNKSDISFVRTDKRHDVQPVTWPHENGASGLSHNFKLEGGTKCPVNMLNTFYVDSDIHEKKGKLPMAAKN